MNIALDFDDTYTADPKMYDMLIALAKCRGHDVRIVTCRGYFDGNEDIGAVCQKHEIPALFTDTMQKQVFCTRIGWQVDVWIDDWPVNIPTPMQIGNKWSVLKDKHNMEGVE